jgi:hypothetical protein
MCINTFKAEAECVLDMGVCASYQVPIHWNFAFMLMTEPQLHMRLGISAYGTTFGVSMDMVSHFVLPVVYRSLFSCDAQTQFTTILNL